MGVILTKKSMFFIAYIFTLCSWMMDNVSYIGNLLDYVRYFSYLILVVIIFMNYRKFSLKRIFIELLGTIIIVISSIYSGSNTLLTLWVFVLAARDIKFDELIKADFYAKLILVFIVALFYMLGMTNRTVFYGYFGSVRSSMGFGNPNTFGYYIFSLCADYIYLNHKKIALKHSIVLVLISLVVGYLSNSRTSQLLIALLAFTAPIAKLFKRLVEKKYFKVFILSLFLICTILSYYVALNYNPSNDIYYKLNETLSGRVTIAQRFLKKYDISILGNKINLTTYDKSYTYYLDNGYIKLLLNYGLLTYIIVYIIYYKNFKRAFNQKNIILILILSIYLVYGLTENVMFWLSGNIFLLYSICKESNEKLNS